MTSTSHPQAHVPPGTLRLRWSRDFPGSAASPAGARRWIRELLPPGETQDELLTIAGELTANAVTHTRSGLPGGTFSVEISWSPGLIRLIVGDRGAPTPPRLITDSDGTAGRGLLLVSEMARQWGVTGGQDGRRVWADLPQDPGADPVTAVLAVIQHQHPEATAWYGPATGQWWALLQQGAAAGLISAESPSRLTLMLDNKLERRGT